MISGVVPSPSSPKWATPGTLGYYVAAPREAEGEGWWSQGGSNRRPRHCERRALPAELWPLAAAASICVRAASNRRHLQSAPRSSQERRNRRFHLVWPGTSLVCQGGNRYLAASKPREFIPPCVPFSTSFSSFSTSMSGC